MEKRILLASPRGFCMGVERAVRMLEEALRREQGTVYVRRELVHNAALMERFQSLGAVVVREVDQVPPGGTVVFSAHGVAPSPALNGFLTRHGTTPVSDGAPLAALLRRPQVRYRDLRQFDPDMPDLPAEVAEQVEISVKYEGYIRRQMEEVEELRRLEDRPLPPDVDYLGIQGLRLEARQKLDKIRPLNLGQASRVSGVSPADVTALMIYLEKTV